MPFQIIRDDITRVKADAIVNTANPSPVYARGTDGAIYHVAGSRELLKEREKIGEIAPGQAAVTSAFNLPATYIIHTVGPVWIDGFHGEFDTLRSCYRQSLHLALSLSCHSVAFPLISTGIYQFPKDKALKIAMEEFESFLEDFEMEIILVVFDKTAYQLSSRIQSHVQQYIDENYVERQYRKEYRDYGAPKPFASNASASKNNRPTIGKVMDAIQSKSERRPRKKKDLSEAVLHLGETFQQRLLRMIDERGLSDPDVYKRANIDRRLFSKIRCNEAYMPKKKTVAAFAIALRLNLDDTKDLLRSAGYALTNSSKADVIITFCIENEIYDIFEVNALLFEYDQPILG